MVNTLIRKSMLNVSNTAADLIDGDALGSFTEDDVGSPAWNEIYDTLVAFQDNADIEYIYAVRQTDEDTFAFTVDPDPVAPGEFGEEILVTDALRQAGKGIAGVDNAPAEDEWGDFYSSFSPVFYSQGRVAGVIGVDFDSAWFDEQIWKNTGFVILFSVLFTAVGAAVFLLLNNRVRTRFDRLNAELAKLFDDVESLTQELVTDAGYAGSAAAEEQLPRPDDRPDESDDEIRALGRRIHTMHQEMEQYLDYVHAQVYTDTLTRVGNTTGYLERMEELIEAFNRDNPGTETDLSLSRGYARFIRGTDHSFRDVFVRADMQMYEQKDRYHRRDRERQER